MRKNALLWLIIVGLISTVGLLACSDQAPFAPGSDSASLVTEPGSTPADNDGAVIPGEYIVVLKSAEADGLGKRAAQDALRVARSAGVSSRHVYGAVLSGFAGKLSDEQYQTLLNNPAVDYIEPNRTIHMIAQTIPWGITRVNAQTAHGRGVTGSGVKVGIIDTGIDYGHPDLAANYAGGIDYVNNDNDPMDDEGHGTHVSGTVAAIDNTIGVLGVAPAASLYGIKVLDRWGNGTFADVIAGIDWAAANNMDVANMSLGASVGSGALQTACDNAYTSGVVLCAAAGNDYGGSVSYPARYSSCIAVSSIDQNDNLSGFSNVGPEVEVTAPGSSVYSTYPGGYATGIGTSMATPHATGVCALIWATGGYPTAVDVRNRLTSTCFDIGPAGRDNSFGFGVVDADAATAGGGPPPNQPPVANANGPYSGTVGSPVSFSSAGSNDPDGTIVGYSWDFGDGGASTAANPSYTYATAGTYNVTLTVTDDQGTTGSNSTTATITGGGGDVVTITSADYRPDKQELKVRAQSTDPSATLTVVGYGVMTYRPDKNRWELKKKPVSPCPQTVTVTSDLGGSDSSPVNGCTGGNQPPTANANGPYSGTVGSPVSFSSAGSSDPDGIIVGYSWDFGDGSTSTAANPSYTYAAAGAYSVTLTVTDDQGATGSNSTTANITGGGGGNQPPVANANGPYSGTAGSAVSFSSAGSNDPDGTIVGYSWDFGDGGTSTAANPSYTYAVAGTYTVTLTVTDDQGATGSNSTTATITSGGGGDVVTITKAQYDGRKQKLDVRAESSGAPSATLTVVGYGVMTYRADKNRYELKLQPVSPGPTTVTVTSDQGGSDTSPVQWK